MIAVIYVAVARDQAPHWEKKEKKLAWAKNGGKRLTLSPSPGHRYIFLILPRFLPFLPTARGVWFQARVAAGFIAHSC